MAEAKRSARYFAEFLGTFLLSFTIGCNVLGGGAWGVTSIAFVLVVLVYAFAGSSGANFNPAVSLALGISDKLQWDDVLAYCVCQLLGGAFGAMTYAAVFWQVFNVGPKPGFGMWQACAIEVFYTAILCFVVLSVACSKHNSTAENQQNQFFGIAIGFVIIAGGYGGGAISGGAFNPAIALSADVVSLGLGFGYGILYTLCELGGALIAAGLFRALRPDEFDHLYFSSGKAYGLPVRLAAEFLGTFTLVFTACLNIHAKSPAGAWSIGACLTAMVYSLGDVSGGHLNPAVTITIICGGRHKCPPMEGGFYVLVQLVAGVLAAYCACALCHFKTFPLANPDTSYLSIGVGEVFFTFLLCYTVLSLATVDPDRTAKSKDIYGLGIGFCVLVGGTASGPTSGGVLNPAVALGIAMVHIMDTTKGFAAVFLYVICQLVGAGAAAGLFFVTHPQEYGKASPLPIKG